MPSTSRKAASVNERASARRCWRRAARAAAAEAVGGSGATKTAGTAGLAAGRGAVESFGLAGSTGPFGGRSISPRTESINWARHSFVGGVSASSQCGRARK